MYRPRRWTIPLVFTLTIVASVLITLIPLFTLSSERQLYSTFATKDDSDSILGVPQHDNVENAGSQEFGEGPLDYNLIDTKPECLTKMGRGYCPEPADGQTIPELYMSFKDRAMFTILNTLRMAPHEYVREFGGSLSCDARPLAPFRYDSPLQQAAKQASKILADPECPFQHNTCNKYCNLYNSCSYMDRITKYSNKYSGVGENIVAGPPRSYGALKYWIESAAHCVNIFDEGYDHIGVAYWFNPNAPYRNYWTTDFGDRGNVVYDSPIYSGVHLVMTDENNPETQTLRFLLNYYSTESTCAKVTVHVGAESYKMELHFGTSGMGSWMKDFDSFPFVDCSPYYFEVEEANGKTWQLPESGSFYTSDINGCTKNWDDMRILAPGSAPKATPSPTSAATTTAEAATDPAPSPASSDAGPYSYVGCFKDDTDHKTMAGTATIHNAMTQQWCYDYCKEKDKDTAYFGLQPYGQVFDINYDSCYCTIEEAFRTASTGSCTHACVGDESQICGGHLSLSVFKIN